MKRISCNWRRSLMRDLLALLIVTMLGQLGKAVAEEQNGMILIPTRKVIVGTSDEERRALAKRYDCHPTWLSDELPRREVELPAFWIDRYPVTNAQYLAFVQETKHAPPFWWKLFGGMFPNDYADHPVVGVGAQDAVAYAKWSGKRLPRAEEWEAAVAGADHSLFAWGDAWPGPLKHVGEAPVFSDRPGTRPVGSGECGRSAAGVEDFAGQALEWSADARADNSSQARILKGASWIHQDPLNFRVASGYYASENWQSLFTGLRCAGRQGDASEGCQSPGQRAPTEQHAQGARFQNPAWPVPGGRRQQGCAEHHHSLPQVRHRRNQPDGAGNDHVEPSLGAQLASETGSDLDGAEPATGGL